MSASPCPSSVPMYYERTLDAISLFSIPINCVAFYLVIFQSPKMKGYKYCLLYLQFVSFISEIWISLISPGYYFLPLVGGFNSGSEAFSSHARMTVWLFLFAFELPSMFVCFVYRNNAAEDIGFKPNRKRYFKKVWLVVTHIHPFFVAFAFWKSGLTYQQKYDYVKNYWPECLECMRFGNFVAYDYKMNPWMAVVGVGAVSFVLIVYGYGFFLGINTMIILQSFRRSMSPQTYQLHKTALFGLVMQLLIPGVLIMVPLSICLFVVITKAVELQGLATNQQFLICSHSMCAALVMIATNSNYRKVLKEKVSKILFKIYKMEQENVVSHGGNSVSVTRI